MLVYIYVCISFATSQSQSDQHELSVFLLFSFSTEIIFLEIHTPLFPLCQVPCVSPAHLSSYPKLIAKGVGVCVATEL